MNLQPINPYQIIKGLEEENQALKEENERLKEELENNVSVDESDNRQDEE